MDPSKTWKASIVFSYNCFNSHTSNAQGLCKVACKQIKQLGMIELLSCPGLSIKTLRSHFLKPQMIYDTRNDGPAKVYNKGKKGLKYIGFQWDDDRQNAVVDKWDLHNGVYSTLPVSCEFNVGKPSLALVLEDFSSPSWRRKASVWPIVSLDFLLVFF